MSNLQHELALQRGVEHWNRWRKAHASIKPDLSKAQLIGWDLRGADLRDADLEEADLSDSRLGINLEDPRFTRDQLLSERWLGQVATRKHGRPADLRGANLDLARLVGADLRWVSIGGASLREAAMSGAKLGHAGLEGADLRECNLGSDVGHVRTALTYADLNQANLLRANLRNVDARNASLQDAQLSFADCREADLSNSSLRRSLLVGTKLDGAVLRGAEVYGVAAWDVSLSQETIQKDLVIARSPNDPRIAVDDIRVAQFIYLLLDNRNISEAVDTIGRKGVLLLGRYSPERKRVLDSLREELRQRGYLPIVFDFERATTKDITETIMVLAGLSLFIIADITNPKCAPLELQATVPNYMTPFVPIIQRNEQPFSMLNDLRTKYHWVLERLTYDTSEQLRENFGPAILEPALEMHERLVREKGQATSSRDIRDYYRKDRQEPDLS